MSFCLTIAEAIGKADDTNRKTFIGDVKNTIYLAFSLMNIQAAWLTVKANDRMDAVIASMEPGGAALAAYYAGQYQAHDQESSIATTQSRTMVTANQAQIDMLNDSRKNNFSIADGIAAMLSSTNGLINVAGAA